MEKIKSFLSVYLIDLIILGMIFIFLLSFFEPKYLLSNTITNGGDTASHYYTAQYLKEVLLPQGKVMGWMMANYCGFPIFYHYFPLPFLLMAWLGHLIPLQISFKLITVLGTFLLPLSVFLMFRILGYRHPTPIIGALFSLAFLFNEKNSMWGGNIPSTLAGEFSFSLSLAVFIVFLATFYQGIKENKWIGLNAFLFFLMGFSHGYTLMFFSFLCLFYFFNKNIFRNALYLFKVYALGGMLLAFWLLPFMANAHYVTPFYITWDFGSLWEVFPPILIPFFLLSIITFIFNFRDRRIIFFIYAVLAAILLYFLGPRIGLVDIRFLTFAQFFLALIGAVFFQKIYNDFKFPSLFPTIMMLAVLVWVSINTSYIKNWISWNYSGFERKPAWGTLTKMFDHIRQQKDHGRVVYENALVYNAFGTQRIFESLKMFAGRDTLEGLYMQSSLTGPFVFYIQSEISQDVSAPFWSHPVSPFNLKNGAQHLNNFAVSRIIVRSDKVKKAIKGMPEYKFEKRFDVCDVYKVVNTDPHYVVPAKREPVLYSGKDWKMGFYKWFKIPEIQEVPVVYVKKPSKKEKGRFKYTTKDPTAPANILLATPKYSISEQIGNETIEFETSLVGHPHIIRVTYHPNWQVEGAEKVYLTTPNFMLVYPKQNKVKLTFTKSKFNYAGEFISFLALLLLIIIPTINKFKNGNK